MANRDPFGLGLSEDDPRAPLVAILNALGFGDTAAVVVGHQNALDAVVKGDVDTAECEARGILAASASLAAGAVAAAAAGPIAKFVKIPNPGGRLGNAVTRQTTRNLIARLEAQGLRVDQEVRFLTPGGFKSTRFADVVATNPATGDRQIFQIGLTTKGGLPVARERAAIIDIANSPNFRPSDQLFFLNKFTGNPL